MLVVVCHRVSSLAVICGTGLFWLDVPSAVVVSVYAVLVAVVGLAVPGVALGRDLWIPAPLDVSDGQLPALDALRLGALGEPLIDELGVVVQLTHVHLVLLLFGRGLRRQDARYRIHSLAAAWLR